MRIDFATLIGGLVAVGGIILAFVLKGGNPANLINAPTAAIIFGGTFGAIIITRTLYDLKQVPGVMKTIFTETKYDYIGLISELSDYAKTARTQGVVALDEIKDNIEDPFLKRGLTLVIDSIEPENVKEFLENEISMMEERHKNHAQMFDAAGSYAPTMGIMGAVLGLIVVLAGLGSSSTAELGYGISSAFLATFVSVFIANAFFLPWANKLKIKSNHEVLYREMAMQGIIAIQSQESPILLRKRLFSFLPEYMKKGKEEV